MFKFIRKIIDIAKPTSVFCDVCALKANHVVSIEIVYENEDKETIKQGSRYCDHCLERIIMVIKNEM
jgi:hypothetical protein|tara:strand:+ start:2166 stop:2366 length:201 start_codon:yes stop_codon:yes gene_type:complete